MYSGDELSFLSFSLCKMLHKNSSFILKNELEVFQSLNVNLIKLDMPNFEKVLTFEDLKLVFSSRFQMCEILYILFEILTFNKKTERSEKAKAKLLFYIDYLYKLTIDEFNIRTFRLATTWKTMENTEQ